MSNPIGNSAADFRAFLDNNIKRQQRERQIDWFYTGSKETAIRKAEWRAEVHGNIQSVQYSKTRARHRRYRVHGPESTSYSTEKRIFIAGEAK